MLRLITTTQQNQIPNVIISITATESFFLVVYYYMKIKKNKLKNNKYLCELATPALAWSEHFTTVLPSTVLYCPAVVYVITVFHLQNSLYKTVKWVENYYCSLVAENKLKTPIE